MPNDVYLTRHKVHFSSRTDEWSTPPCFAEKYGPFDLDPAATEQNARAPKFFTREECGLTQDWGVGRVWLNPPYGRTIGLWVKKAVEASRKGATVVCLLPARTDTRWWHDYVIPYGKVEFVRGRLKFGGARNSAPFPSAVVIFEKDKQATVKLAKAKAALQAVQELEV